MFRTMAVELPTCHVLAVVVVLRLQMMLAAAAMHLSFLCAVLNLHELVNAMNLLLYGMPNNNVIWWSALGMILPLNWYPE